MGEEDSDGVDRRTILLVVLGIGLALCPLIYPPPATASPPVEESHSNSARSGWSTPDSGNVAVSVSRVGNNTIHAEFEVNKSASNFGLSGTPGVSWKEMDGFQRATFGGPVWNNSAYRASINYSYPTETPQQTTLGFSRAEFFNESSWALAPGIQVDGETAVVKTKTAGTPVGAYIYFGEYEEQKYEIENQTIRFVAAKGSGFKHEATAKTLNQTASYVKFSSPESRLPFIVLPTRMKTAGGSTEWLTRSSGSTIILSKPTKGVRNIVYRWTAPIVASHEYIHSYQSYWNPKPNAQWFFEATAVYYSQQSLHHSGAISDIDYRASWARWQGRINNSSVLSQPRTWGQHTPYARGSYVLAGLDQRIRNRTDGNASLQTVLNDVEMHRNPGLSDFNQSIHRIAGAETAEWFMQHTTTSTLPESATQSDISWWSNQLWLMYAQIGALPLPIRVLFYLMIGVSLGGIMDASISKAGEVIDVIQDVI